MNVPRSANTTPAVTDYGHAELEAWMAEHGDAVLRTAYVMLRDRQKAEDAYQEVFVRVYRNRDKMRRMDNARGWVIRIAVNICRDMLRSAWWRRVLYRDEPDVSSPADSAEQRAIASENDRELLELVMSLDEPYRVVVLLYYYHEMSTEEIAGLLRVREGTVRSRLHRARGHLRDVIEQREGYDR